VFRVDHFLAMSTVQNLLGTRFANRVLEPLWNAGHIGEVEIAWEETLGLEGRAGYYDRVGALKDMVQNHLLQLLCLVAMEPPISLGARDLRDRKLDVLRSVRPISPAAVPAATRRARYEGYAAEPGVEPGRETETFTELVLELEGWRWAGTRFRLRTGKALTRDRKELVVRFRPVPHLPFDRAGTPAPNVLRFGLEPEHVRLELNGIGAGGGFPLAPLRLDAEVQAAALPAYSRLLLEVLEGRSTLSIRGDEAEESWRVLQPVLAAWAEGVVPLEEYPVGSHGPEPLPGHGLLTPRSDVA
jgi:glucose-6-phosphate 1-dehydrogenase